MTRLTYEEREYKARRLFDYNFVLGTLVGEMNRNANHKGWGNFQALEAYYGVSFSEEDREVIRGIYPEYDIQAGTSGRICAEKTLAACGYDVKPVTLSRTLFDKEVL